MFHSRIATEGDASVNAPVLNAMSVDVEDWFQVGAFETTIRRADWDGLEHRVEANADAVIALFERCGVKATFFTLGWVGERYPKLMRRIVVAGHELASHGYDHARVFTMSPQAFRADIARTRAILEDASGQAVTGYRAPSFSIDQRTPWAHEILAAEGYAYSSSVAPLAHDHYGWSDSPRFAWRPVKGAAMIELPVTVAAIGPKRIATGGGFFRLLPRALTTHAIRTVNADQRPAIFYFHPWDMDPDQPRVANAPLRSKLRHYPRLAAMEGKLEALMRDLAWGRTDRVAMIEAARTP